MNTPIQTKAPDARILSATSTDPVCLSAQDTGENSEDPYSPGLQPFALLLGSLIGILSLTVPLVAVVAGRHSPSGPAILHGSPTPACFPSARAGESAGGDSGWFSQ